VRKRLATGATTAPWRQMLMWDGREMALLCVLCCSALILLPAYTPRHANTHTQTNNSHRCAAPETNPDLPQLGWKGTGVPAGHLAAAAAGTVWLRLRQRCPSAGALLATMEPTLSLQSAGRACAGWRSNCSHRQARTVGRVDSSKRAGRAGLGAEHSKRCTVSLCDTAAAIAAAVLRLCPCLSNDMSCSAWRAFTACARPTSVSSDSSVLPCGHTARGS
jgi:hypothetical protein